MILIVFNYILHSHYTYHTIQDRAKVYLCLCLSVYVFCTNVNPIWGLYAYMFLFSVVIDGHWLFLITFYNHIIHHTTQERAKVYICLSLFVFIYVSLSMCLSLPLLLFSVCLYLCLYIYICICTHIGTLWRNELILCVVIDDLDCF